ncbi:hypothetical protein B6J65_28895 [Klebsiella quasipneumoniae]|uniref:hypothetical protein n=1 Tax=Klebsiella quasipneumoniae TaxID=1463165 RepID=UPI000C7D10CE|nr:hypothetical protein [Klebsiella quasipneumoniae]PLJ44360.1 hypothetical protein B6J65_28895 [Klebsiella quasipneumoniae]
MKLLVSALCFISFSCLSQSLDDFFRDNPELKSNPYTRSAVVSEAGVATVNDVLLEKKPGEMSAQVMKRLLKENGYNYALVAVRQLSELCRQGVAESAANLKKEDCELIEEHNK